MGLRHAALTHGGPSVPPPQGYRIATAQRQSNSGAAKQSPPLKLPTLLQHSSGRDRIVTMSQHKVSPTKAPPRRKPPLQGVSPQAFPAQGASLFHQALLEEKMKKGSQKPMSHIV